jgi:hypothetical protein
VPPLPPPDSKEGGEGLFAAPPLAPPPPPLLLCCVGGPPVGVVGLLLWLWLALLSFDVALLTSLAREEGWMGDADFLDDVSPFPPRDEFRGETRPVWY